MLDFALRNLELFFRDKAAVMLSLLAEVIIMVLYIVFMRENLLESFPRIKNAEEIFDLWMIAGILGITPVTAAMGAYGVMIEDTADKRDKDFIISPLGDASMIAGYLISAAITGIIISLAVFVMSQIYMELMYEDMAASEKILEIYLMIVLNSVCCGAMILLPVIFIRTSNALAGCCTILGALIGFMTGIYLPAGSLGDNIRLLITAFPVSHGVAVFRQLLSEPIIKTYMVEEAAAEFMEYMGVYLYLNEDMIASSSNASILMLSAATCFIAVMIIRRCRKRL